MYTLPYSWKKKFINLRRVFDNMSIYPYRFVTSHKRCIPSFLIVGAQKSGTSSLFSYLSAHPSIVPPIKKEIHFFDWYSKFIKGESFYRAHFPLRNCRNESFLSFESTPYYMYHPLSAKRISSFFDKIKLIFLLRDPTDRAISHYWHEANYVGSEPLSMKEAFGIEYQRLRSEESKIKSDPTYYSYEHQRHSYLDRGLYYEQIKSFADHFDRQNLCFIKSADLFSSPYKALSKIYKFLSIENTPPDSLSVHNEGDYSSNASTRIRSLLDRFYFYPNIRLKSYVGVDFT